MRIKWVKLCIAEIEEDIVLSKYLFRIVLNLLKKKKLNEFRLIEIRLGILYCRKKKIKFDLLTEFVLDAKFLEIMFCHV